MIGARKVARQESAIYASGTDFCRIFKKNMNHLYLLSFLLTGDQAMAEKCFVSGLEDSKKSSPVFREWAESWARRTVIQNAIRMIHPRAASSLSAETERRPSEDLPAEIAAIIGLSTFDRFVFVMAVLEHYSDQECSLLLDCSRSDVVAARNRALRQIGGSAKSSPRVASTDSFDPKVPATPTLEVGLGVVPQMAASA